MEKNVDKKMVSLKSIPLFFIIYGCLLLSKLFVVIATEQLTTTYNKLFYYTGYPQNYTVPDGITLIQAQLAGANGGWTNGYRSQVITNLAVTPGQILYIYVGGEGGIGGGGWNGGGVGTGTSYGGGGATDIRTQLGDLSSRIAVASGSGGGCPTTGDQGGSGGCQVGYQGTPTTTTAPYGGYGGNQTHGGRGGYYSAAYPPGNAGQFGLGGGGASNTNSGGGGGGKSWIYTNIPHYSS